MITVEAFLASGFFFRQEPFQGLPHFNGRMFEDAAKVIPSAAQPLQAGLIFSVVITNYITVTGTGLFF